MSVFNSDNKLLKDCSDVLSYPFAFKIFKDTDLKVFLIDPETQEETALVLGVDYEVKISRISDGGSIELYTSHPGYQLYAYRELELIQPEEVPTEGYFPESTIEDAFDRGIMISQQLKEILNRSIKIKGFLESKDINPNGIDVELPIPVANKILMWDGNGKAIINSSVNATELESMAYRLHESADNIDIVANDINNVNACAKNETNINKCVNNQTNINACVNNASNINACVQNSNNINACVSNSNNINACVQNKTNINSCVSNASNINKCASNMSLIQSAPTNATIASQKAEEAAASAELAESYKKDIATFDFVDGGYAYTTPLNEYDGGNANEVELDIIEGSDAYGLFRITFDDISNINKLSYLLDTVDVLVKQVTDISVILTKISNSIDGGRAF